VFVHSSDELYGADRIVLDIHDALPPAWRDRAEFWLPTDVRHDAHPLCVALRERSATVHHVNLPILRRSYRSPRALLGLVGRTLASGWRLVRVRPAGVYLTTSATFALAPVARAVGVPLVVGHVQEIWSRSDAAVLGPLARGCHRLLTISGPVLEALPTRLRERATTVLNATRSPARLVPLEEHDGPLRFVVASRWNAWKGHATLLRAWDLAGSPGHLTVLGGPPPNGESVDVRALVAALETPGSVEVVGETTAMEDHLDRADVVVVPSDQPEPFGLVAAEAFAHGRPVVASAAGGLADVVTHGQDGWTYPLGDASALADVLAGLDRPTVVTAGRRARETYEQRFTAHRYAREWQAAVGAPADV